MLQGDISKLPERGHFYFAPTQLIDYQEKLLRTGQKTTELIRARAEC